MEYIRRLFSSRTFLVVVLVIFYLLISGACEPATQNDQGVIHRSRIENPWGTFELRLTTRTLHRDDQHHRRTLCEYEVCRNGQVLVPQRREDRPLVGCAMIGPEQVVVKTIGDGEEAVGWMVGAGGICGNTFSWKWRLITPSGRGDNWSYRTETFIAKEEPIVRGGEGVFEIWSQYQEWGRTGTAFSFFVPELRLVSRDPARRPIIARGKLPPDPSAWPDMDWLSPIGNYVAGISQLNPELMTNVAENIAPEDEKIFHAHELPADRDNLLKLAEKIEKVRRTSWRFHHFQLDWSSF